MTFPDLTCHVDDMNPVVDEKVDKTILSELSIANIPVLTLPSHSRSGVPYKVMGVLTGKNNFKVYQEIFSWYNPDNDFTIHAEFVFIRAWYYWVVKGFVPLEVANELYEDPYGRKSVRAAGDASADSSPAKLVKPYLVCGKKVVDSYHIDDQAGLNLFVRTVLKHKLFED